MAAAQRRPGQLLALSNLVAALGYFGYTIARYGLDLDAIGDCLSILTRIGMVYFMLAFVARPLHDLVDTRATAWLVSNRRYLGLSFAAWHLLHWPIIACFIKILGPSEFWDDFNDIFAPGVVILSVITFMAATSSDRTQRWLGMRTWSALHTIGTYTIWAWAFQIYLQRVPERADTHDYVYVWALVAVLAVRWIALIKRVVTRP